jgi:hypothetical protein
VREICTHGSEGGGPGLTGPPYPYHMALLLPIRGVGGDQASVVVRPEVRKPLMSR